MLGRAAPLDGRGGWQSSLRGRASCDGIGLHSGRPVRLTIGPAPASSGIVFRRAGRRESLPARFDLVADTRLCTQLGSSDPSLQIGTIEHLMAALSATGVDNALIEVEGAELPIIDGSSRPFLALLRRAGVVAQPVARRAIEVCRTVRVTDGAGFAELSPGADFSLDVSIDFEAGAIGRQRLVVEDLDERRFAAELAGARTFTMVDEIDRRRQSGLARGGSLDNAVVVDGSRVLNPGGLRWPDEFVRHKMLDVIGDLALAGGPILGRFTGHRCGHGLNNRLLRALFADPANWRSAAPPAKLAEATRAA